MIGKIFSEVKVIYVERLPIKPIDFSNKEEKSLHDKIVGLVESILELKTNEKGSRTPENKEFIQNKINFLLQSIDQLIFKLYGIKDHEILKLN